MFHIPLHITVLSVCRAYPFLGARKKRRLHYFIKETALKSLKYARYKIIDSFYIVGAIELDKPGIVRKVLRLPRKLAFYFHQDLRPEYLGVFL